MPKTPSEGLQLADYRHLFKDDLSYQAFVQSLRESVTSNGTEPTPVLVDHQLICLLGQTQPVSGDEQ